MYESIINGVWPEWKVREKFSEGIYGVTYRVEKNVSGSVVEGAIKVIAFPKTAAEEELIRKQHGSDSSVQKFLQEAINEYRSKMKLLEPFRYHRNMVSVEEYRFINKKDAAVPVVDSTTELLSKSEGMSLGYYLLIQMEYLTPLNSAYKGGAMTESDVIRMGIDIANALEICESCRSLHNNLKPENIFVDDKGNFQLGDYALSGAMDMLANAFTKKKVTTFLSPEAFKNEPTDPSSDLYSLGLVMYRGINKGKLPFQDADVANLSFAQKKDALNRRFAGEAIPAPAGCSPELAHILQRACAFAPQDRYQSADELRSALQALEKGTYKMEEDIPEYQKEAAEAKAVIPELAEAEAAAQEAAEEGKEKKRIRRRRKKEKDNVIIGVLVAAIVVIALGTALVYISENHLLDDVIPKDTPTAVVEIVDMEQA
ncbi:MAG: protein kinase [Lachnospiraceae bacterium]|nr:protein kinase [Lachnospiraceae bacterium]